jgi:insertion element IS1 protein InsB
MAMNRIAFLAQVAAQSVLTWLSALAKAHDEKPKPSGQASILELDERWHSIQKKRQQLWIGQALDPESGKLLAWAGGRRAQATWRQMVGRRAQFNVPF